MRNQKNNCNRQKDSNVLLCDEWNEYDKWSRISTSAGYLCNIIDVYQGSADLKKRIFVTKHNFIIRNQVRVGMPKSI